MKNEEYKRLCIVDTKDVQQATYYKSEDHGKVPFMTYVPCRGFISGFQSKEEKTKLKYILLEDYGDYYCEHLTGHIVGIGVPENAPLYIDGSKHIYCVGERKEPTEPLYVSRNARTFTYSEDEAYDFIRRNPDYELSFCRMYAAGLNAINSYNNDKQFYMDLKNKGLQFSKKRFK